MSHKADDNKKNKIKKTKSGTYLEANNPWPSSLSAEFDSQANNALVGN
jgi:hypothetical protein